MNVSGMKNTLAGRDKEVLVKVMGENKQHLPIFVKAGHKLGGCFLPYRFLLVLRYGGGVFFLYRVLSVLILSLKLLDSE